jgi:hypothetical protein
LLKEQLLERTHQRVVRGLAGLVVLSPPTCHSPPSWTNRITPFRSMRNVIEVKLLKVVPTP